MMKRTNERRSAPVAVDTAAALINSLRNTIQVLDLVRTIQPPTSEEGRKVIEDTLAEARLTLAQATKKVYGR